MLDIGWTELLLIGVVALIVVGPKDLPGMFRTLGKFTARIKAMAREFQTSMEAAADEAGVKDVAKDLQEMSSPTKFGMNKVSEAVDEFKKWTPDTAPETPAQKGPETAKLSEERAEAARKIREKSAEVAGARVEAEKEAAAQKTAPKKAAAKKPAAKKATAKKPAAKKPSAAKGGAKKKAAAKTPPADKSDT